MGLQGENEKTHINHFTQFLTHSKNTFNVHLQAELFVERDSFRLFVNYLKGKANHMSSWTDNDPSWGHSSKVFLEHHGDPTL